MINKNTPRAKKFYEKRPIIEIYKGYEIRKFEDIFEVIANVGVYGCSSTHIKDCYEFIDNLVNHDINSCDTEKIAKYVFNKK